MLDMSPKIGLIRGRGLLYTLECLCLLFVARSQSVGPLDLHDRHQGFEVVKLATYIITTSLQCSLFAFQWSNTILGGHFLNIKESHKSASELNIAVDSIYLTLSIHTIINRQITNLQRLRVGICVIIWKSVSGCRTASSPNGCCYMLTKAPFHSLN